MKGAYSVLVEEPGGKNHLNYLVVDGGNIKIGFSRIGMETPGIDLS
jgi:hypothetical protein